MPTYGPNFAATYGTTGGIASWTNTSRMSSDSDSNLSSSYQFSDFETPTLSATAFGFSIPSDETIVGIKFEVRRSSNISGAVEDSSVILLGGSGTSSNKEANTWTDSGFEVITYGGAADVWGKTYSYMQLNDASFGISITIANSINPFVTASIEYIRATVYTESSGGGGGGKGIYAHNSFLTFRNLAIPKGTVINNAFIRFTAKDGLGVGAGNSNDIIKAMLLGEAADTATNPTSAEEAYALPKTTSCQAWDNISHWVDESTYDSPDISCVIQEIVDRSGWVSGNNITIFVEDYDSGNAGSTGTAQLRSAYDYGEDSGKAAQLFVYYVLAEVGSGGAVVGGESPNLKIITGTTSGGAIVGGSALNYVDISINGGIVVGGLSPSFYTYNNIFSGGLTASGSVVESHVESTTISGGVSCGGLTSPNLTYEITSSGGVNCNGNLTLAQFYYSDIIQGGLEASGTAICLRAITEYVNGGAVSGGECITEIIYIGKGGQVASGSSTNTAIYNILAQGGAGISGYAGTDPLGAVCGGESNSFTIFVNENKIGTVVGGSAIPQILTINQGTGGGNLGGVSPNTAIFNLSLTGGLVAAKTNPVSIKYNPICSGGTEASGTVIYRNNINEFGVGGTVTAGVSEKSVEYYTVMNGGSKTGGHGNENVYRNYSTQADGTISTGGDSIELFQLSFEATAGAITSGEAPVGVELIYGRCVALGGVLLAGPAIIERDTYQYSANGFTHMGGQSQVDYTYFDRTCVGTDVLPCIAKFPNKYKECYQVAYYLPVRKKSDPKNSVKGAFLPAITVCQQGLFLPPADSKYAPKN